MLYPAMITHICINLEHLRSCRSPAFSILHRTVLVPSSEIATKSVILNDCRSMYILTINVSKWKRRIICRNIIIYWYIKYVFNRICIRIK